MVSSTRQAVACVLLILCAAGCAHSQSVTEKSATASISGKVTVKGKGVPGIVVVANERNVTGPNRPRYRATTDQTGNYRISLPAGTYQVVPILLSLVPENLLSNKFVIIGDGETLEDFNFTLIRGGVITGKITDSEGKPLIDAAVSIVAVEGPSDNIVYSTRGRQTDDRGIYRAFGLAPGKYRVFVGTSRSSFGDSQGTYRQTFYPSVTDVEKATLIEITEGGEISNIDIVMGRPLTTFRVTGRIVDGETGKPLPNVMYAIGQKSSDGSQQITFGGKLANARGEFKLENLLPGKYSVFVENDRNSNFRGNSVPFEVVDRDISDLVIKLSKGSTLSGVVVLEGAEEKALPTTLSGLYIRAWLPNSESNFAGNSAAPVKPDGSFTIGGLRSGITRIDVDPMPLSGSKYLAVVRVERDGIAQPGGINVKEGEQVTDVRVVIKYLTGTIRGQVKIEGSEPPPASRISVWLRPVDDARTGYLVMMHDASTDVDSRGRFIFDGLAAGTYDVNVTVFDPGQPYSNQTSKQQVIVTDNTVSEVTVTLKPKP